MRNSKTEATLQLIRVKTMVTTTGTPSQFPNKRSVPMAGLNIPALLKAISALADDCRAPAVAIALIALTYTIADVAVESRDLPAV
jgi:hypothetical protein